MQYTTGGVLARNSSSKWTINGGLMADETSDWACAALLHYNRELSLAEVHQVEDWLDGMYAVVRGGWDCSSQEVTPCLEHGRAPAAASECGQLPTETQNNYHPQMRTCLDTMSLLALCKGLCTAHGRFLHATR